MAISYPLTLPSKKPQSVTLGMETAVALQRSPFTFQAQAQVHQGQAWTGQMVLPPMRRADAEAWLAFLLALNGQEGTFLLPAAFLHPDYALLGVGGGTPLVDGSGQTGRTLNMKGLPISTSGVWKAGDYFGLGSDDTSRLHKVLQDVDSDGSGLAAVEIFPRLRESPADADPIEVAAPAGLFRLAANQVNWTIDTMRTFGVGFSIMEAI